MELITGHGGTPHISSADVGALLAGAVAEECYCFGEKPILAIIDANTLSIGAAELLLNGRHVRITDAETVHIESGAVGYYRHDLVVCRYSYNTSTRVESVELVVVTGTAANTKTAAVDPTTEYMNTSILDGSLIVDIPIVRVILEGVAPTASWLLPEMPSMQELAQSIVDNTAAIANLQDSVNQKLTLNGVSNIAFGNWGTDSFYIELTVTNGDHLRLHVSQTDSVHAVSYQKNGVEKWHINP